MGLKQREIAPLELGDAASLELRMGVQVCEEPINVIHEHGHTLRRLERGPTDGFEHELRINVVAALDPSGEQGERFVRVAQFEQGAGGTLSECPLTDQRYRREPPVALPSLVAKPLGPVE